MADGEWLVEDGGCGNALDFVEAASRRLLRWGWSGDMKQSSSFSSSFSSSIRFGKRLSRTRTMDENEDEPGTRCINLSIAPRVVLKIEPPAILKILGEKG